MCLKDKLAIVAVSSFDERTSKQILSTLYYIRESAEFIGGFSPKIVRRICVLYTKKLKKESLVPENVSKKEK